MTLHLKCGKCDFLDIVKYENGRHWKCPNCEINQPERLSPEDDRNIVCDSLNSVEIQRGRSEEVSPPRDRSQK
jgi:hypothetical protein